jgi:hypothetical protein
LAIATTGALARLAWAETALDTDGFACQGGDHFSRAGLYGLVFRGLGVKLANAGGAPTSAAPAQPDLLSLRQIRMRPTRSHAKDFVRNGRQVGQLLGAGCKVTQHIRADFIGAAPRAAPATER